MSTKIYNGMVTNIKSMRIVLEKLKKFREEVYNPILEEEVARVTGRLNNRVYDAMRLGFLFEDSFIEEGDNHFKGSSHYLIRKEWELGLGVRQLGDAYIYSLMNIYLYPLKNRILILPITRNAKLLDKLLEEDWINDYGYWDNVDRDEKCTAREWNKRKKDWEKIGYLPKDNMVQYQMHSTYPPVKNPELIDKTRPSKEQRIEEVLDVVYNANPGKFNRDKARTLITEHIDEESFPTENTKYLDRDNTEVKINLREKLIDLYPVITKATVEEIYEDGSFGVVDLKVNAKTNYDPQFVVFKSHVNKDNIYLEVGDTIELHILSPKEGDIKLTNTTDRKAKDRRKVEAKEHANEIIKILESLSEKNG